MTSRESTTARIARAVAAPLLWLALTAPVSAQPPEPLEVQERVDEYLAALGKPEPGTAHLPAPDVLRPPTTGRPYEQQPAAAQDDFRIPGTQGRGIAPSDMRLKTGIAHLATLDNGIRIYAFKYVWGETVHVGVMAQDLLPHGRFKSAVVAMPNGFYGVNYAMLNLRMTTLAAWLDRGLSAVSVQPALR